MKNNKVGIEERATVFEQYFSQETCSRSGKRSEEIIYGMALTQEKEQNGSKNKHKNFLPVIYVHIHESKQADEPFTF